MIRRPQVDSTIAPAVLGAAPSATLDGGSRVALGAQPIAAPSRGVAAATMVDSPVGTVARAVERFAGVVHVDVAERTVANADVYLRRLRAIAESAAATDPRKTKAQIAGVLASLASPSALAALEAGVAALPDRPETHDDLSRLRDHLGDARAGLAAHPEGLAGVDAVGRAIAHGLASRANAVFMSRPRGDAASPVSAPGATSPASLPSDTADAGAAVEASVAGRARALLRALNPFSAPDMAQYAWPNGRLSDAQWRDLVRFARAAGELPRPGASIEVLSLEVPPGGVLFTDLGPQRVQRNGPYESGLLRESSIDAEPREVAHVRLHLESGQVIDTPVRTKGSAGELDFDALRDGLYAYVRGSLAGVAAVEITHTHPYYPVRIVDGETRRMRVAELSAGDLETVSTFARSIPHGKSVVIRAASPAGVTFEMSVATGRA
jgi:hypothetical protein